MATTETVKKGVSRVARRTGRAADAVAETAEQQSRAVADEVLAQAQQLLEQVQHELTTRATARGERVAATLREAGGHLASMADTGEEGSPAQLLVARLGQASDRLAAYLDTERAAVLGTKVKGMRPRWPVFVLAGAALGATAAVVRAVTRRPEPAPSPEVATAAEQEGVIDLTEGSRTVEATVERLGSVGRDPYETGR